MEPVFKDSSLTYRDIWSTFGLNKTDLTRTELHLVCHNYLKTLTLYMPVIDTNKDEDDSCCSEFEEKALV